MQSKIVIRRNFHDIIPTQCGMEACRPLHQFGPAIRDFWLIHFVQKGSGTLETPKNKYTVSKNQIFIIRPFEINLYQADEQDPWEYFWIAFHATVQMPTVFYEEDVITAPELAGTFRSAYYTRDSGEGNDGYEAFLCAKIWEILSLFSEKPKGKLNTLEHYILPAINMMESELHSGITVEDVAERLHLNRSYFSVLFREQMHVTPKEYLTELKMQRAIRFLNDHHMSVSVTASSLGYPDLSSFSRAFKHYYGCSPQCSETLIGRESEFWREPIGEKFSGIHANNDQTT